MGNYLNINNLCSCIGLYYPQEGWYKTNIRKKKNKNIIVYNYYMKAKSKNKSKIKLSILLSNHSLNQ